MGLRHRAAWVWFGADVQCGNGRYLSMVRTLLAQHRGFTRRRPAALHQRRHQKAAFIPPSLQAQGFFNGGHCRFPPPAYRFIVALYRATGTLLRGEARRMEQPLSTIEVIANTEVPLNPNQSQADGSGAASENPLLRRLAASLSAVRGALVGTESAGSFGRGSARSAPRPLRRPVDFQRRTLRSSTPMRRVASTVLRPCCSRARVRYRCCSGWCGATA